MSDSQKVFEAVPHKIAFSTTTISPVQATNFRYVFLSLEYDRLIVAASVVALNVEDARKEIISAFPDALIRRVEAGTDHLPQPHFGTVYGANSVIKPSLLRSILRRVPFVGFFID